MWLEACLLDNQNIAHKLQCVLPHAGDVCANTPRKCKAPHLFAHFFAHELQCVLPHVGDVCANMPNKNVLLEIVGFGQPGVYHR